MGLELPRLYVDLVLSGSGNGDHLHEASAFALKARPRRGGPAYKTRRSVIGVSSIPHGGAEIDGGDPAWLCGVRM